MSMKKILNKARLASKFTKDTKQVAKQHDLRNQLMSAREVNHKKYTGLSKELNMLANQV